MLYESTLWFSLPEAPELVSQCLWQNCAYFEHCSDGPLWACHFLICFRPSGALVWDKSSRIGRMVALRYRQLGFQPRGSVVWLFGLPQLMYLKLIRCVYISSSEYILEFKVVKMFRNLKLWLVSSATKRVGLKWCTGRGMRCQRAKAIVRVACCRPFHGCCLRYLTRSTTSHIPLPVWRMSDNYAIL